METIDENGAIVTDETLVLNRWKNDFEKLYRNENDNAFDSHFQNEALSNKTVLEDNMLDPLYESNSELNQNISLQEIQRIIMNAKNSQC